MHIVYNVIYSLKMDRNLLKNTAQRLNVYDETVLKKAEEYMRLYQSKASIKLLNDQAKIVLCLDLASNSLGKGFDKETALILCAFKKSVYQNNLNTLEKVLNLDRTLTVTDACVQLGCTIIREEAEEILSQCIKRDAKIKDLDHPQYVAAAVYLACKAKKIQIDRAKLLAISRLKPMQWKELISGFKSIELGNGKTKSVSDNGGIGDEIDNNEQFKKEEVEYVEEYEVWKQRILEESYAALREQGKNVDQHLITY